MTAPAENTPGQTHGVVPASPRSPPASPTVVKRKPVPTRDGNTVPGSPVTVEGRPLTPQSTLVLAKAPPPLTSTEAKPIAGKASRPTTPALASRPTTPANKVATPKLASPIPALRGGHTAQAPEHTGPSTGTLVSTSGAPVAPSSPAKQRNALTAGQVRRGGHERNQSNDSVGAIQSNTAPNEGGRFTPGDFHSCRGTPADFQSGRGVPADFLAFTSRTQTPEPGAFYTPPHSAASSVNNFFEAPGATTPGNRSRPGSVIGLGSPMNEPAFYGGATPPRFVSSASNSPSSPLSRQVINRNGGGINRSASLGNALTRSRQTPNTGQAHMPSVQEGLNRARSQGILRRANQFDPVNHGLMSMVDFDSAYPAPALNAHTSTKRRLGSLHTSSVVGSNPSSAMGSSDKLDVPFMPETPSQNINSSSGSVHNGGYAHDDSPTTGYSSPNRSSLNSSGAYVAKVSTSSNGSGSGSGNDSSNSNNSKYTVITRDGSGRLGFRDIIDIATMSPLAFDRLDEVESDDDLHDPEKLEDLSRRANSVRARRGDPQSSKTGRKYRTAVQEKENHAEKDGVAGPPPSKVTETKRVGLRALVNFGGMLIIILGVLMLFAGYPIYTNYRKTGYQKFGAYQIGGTNSTGQVSVAPGIRSTLIDPDTPQDAYTRLGQDGKTEYNLVFSDEFNTPGRSFYPGDDPFWEAVNLNYWQTNNYEWYDPAAVTTRDGALSITLSRKPTHNLDFRGGMVQTWNKFCFTGGYIVVRVRLPGQAKVAGLWPAIWMMGNLGRAGYGASLEGTWPYTYDSCDTGTLANQTDPATLLPNLTTLGDCSFNGQFKHKALSFLPGQKLSACTCPGEDHPGPKKKDGSFKGRASPELDIFEAQVSGTLGMTVSQSLQLAPFNAYYKLSQPAELFNNQSRINSYTGEITQQAASGVTPTDQDAVQYLPDGSTGTFSEYGVEYEPGYDGFIKWEASGKPAWMVNSSQLQPDPQSAISRRPVPEEPLYIIMNLGISKNFGSPQWDQIKWPNEMQVDWVRVYQHGEPRVGCDPPDFPTKDYINRHIEAYTNPNLTLWGNTREEGGYAHNWPKNRLYPGGCDAPASTLPGSPLKPMPKARSYESWQIGQDKSLCAVPNSSD